MSSVLYRKWVRKFAQFFLTVTLLLLSSLLLAEDKVVVITQPDAILTTLKQNVGERVQIKAHSGEEFEGRVKGVWKDRVLSLGDVSGYEDDEGKVVSLQMDLNQISAVILKVPSQ